MKKNRMMRLASGLLVLCLLTTCTISGTFAKYTTTGRISDTARVAKFGVAITTSGSLFSDAYMKAADNIPAATWATGYTANNISVATKSHATDNLVAPGTKSYGNGMSFGVTGTPEVAVEVKTSITAEDIFLAKGYRYGVMVKATVNTGNFDTLKTAGTLYVKDGSNNFNAVSSTNDYIGSSDYYLLTDTTTTALTDDYFPVKYKLTGSTTADNVTAKAVAKNIAQKVDSTASDSSTVDYKAEYNDVYKIYDANTDIGAAAEIGLGNENLTWEWDFDASGSGTNDAKDTILGDMIAARDVASPEYYVVAIDSSSNVKTVTYEPGDDYTVKADGNVVANLRTSFDIELTVTQVD